jgi:hypothetical protein
MNKTATIEGDAGSIAMELWIRRDIYDAAMLRATSQGQTLAAVTRTCLYAAAATSVPITGWIVALTRKGARRPSWDGTIHPTQEAAIVAATEAVKSEAVSEHAAVVLDATSDEARELGVGRLKPRPYGEERERIRISVPREQKNIATTQIEASGRSVPVAVEQLLLTYIDTGTVVGVQNESE